MSESKTTKDRRHGLIVIFWLCAFVLAIESLWLEPPDRWHTFLATIAMLVGAMLTISEYLDWKLADLKGMTK